jgi:hypothetical protein
VGSGLIEHMAELKEIIYVSISYEGAKVVNSPPQEGWMNVRLGERADGVGQSLW